MRQGRRLSRLLAGLLALALASAPAFALTMRRASLQDLSKTNGTIVVGEIVDAYSYWNDDGTWIVTDFKVAPSRVLKGQVPGHDLTLTMLGGTVGDTSVLIPGSPSLEIGKSYVLFVRQADLPGAAKSRTLAGYTQSVFDIVPTKDGPRAFSQAGGAHLLPDADGKTAAAGGSEGLSLEELEAAIHQAISETSTE